MGLPVHDKSLFRKEGKMSHHMIVMCFLHWQIRLCIRTILTEASLLANIMYASRQDRDLFLRLSSFGLAFFRHFVFSPCIISGRKDERAPEKKTKKNGTRQTK